MTGNWQDNQDQLDEALKSIQNINSERRIKGNSAVTAGRYGELVANMIKYSEAKLALELYDRQIDDQNLFKKRN